eukprot:5291330-Pyramimonas_sp.AAC.1
MTPLSAACSASVVSIRCSPAIGAAAGRQRGTYMYRCKLGGGGLPADLLEALLRVLQVPSHLRKKGGYVKSRGSIGLEGV